MLEHHSNFLLNKKEHHTWISYFIHPKRFVNQIAVVDSFDFLIESHFLYLQMNYSTQRFFKVDIDMLKVFTLLSFIITTILLLFNDDERILK